MKQEQIYQIIRRLADGRLPASGRGALLRWLKGHTDEEAKDDALFRVWNETDGGQVSEEKTREALSDFKVRVEWTDKPAVTFRANRVRTLLKYAAMLLLPLFTGMMVWYVMDKRVDETSDMVECYVPRGEQKQVTLPDGTDVVLNSGTLFVYPRHFHGGRRQVYLSGEGFFEVTRDERKPFVVCAGPLDIRVLGTSFNVDAYPEEEEIITTLNTGSVRAHLSEDDSKGVTMKPDEKMVYNKEKQTFELFSVDADEYAAWTEGELLFDECPLAAVLKMLERKYDVTFRCGEGIDLNERYTMKFQPDETIEDVMRILMLASGENVVCSKDGDVIFLQSAGKEVTRP